MSVPLPPAPYPGLRAFRPEEAAIFCGRAEHRSELLDLLADARFLAVVGASGSGKSSLVLAGLIPDIREGRLIGVEGETARIVSTQPGLRPFMNLAGALAAEFGTELPLATLIRRGPAGLIQALDKLGQETERSLVLVIDQFEEIFRFADMSEDQLVREESSYAERPLLDGSENEAQAFVNLLLATATQRRHQVFVLLTMRSEFLARCDQFGGLPEAISRSQFLTPRLDRQQLDQAITRPLDLFAATIEPSLVNLILNQISSAQDQLPLMQHCLARMWEVRAETAGGFTLTIPGYERVGGLTEALNNHGDALCLLLAKDHSIPEAKVEKFFRSLAHHPAAQMAPVRRPVSVAQIAEETGLTTTEVRTIADVFRAEGAHLLMPPRTRTPQLADDDYLDISHESLLRQWRKLRDWLEAEWRQRIMAEELVRSMKDWEQTAPEPRGDIVRRFQRWKQAGEAVATRLYRDAEPVFFGPHALPNPGAWARRYAIDWPRLASFCREAFSWKKVTSVMSKMGAGLVVLTVLLMVAVVWAIVQTKQAQKDSTAAYWAQKQAESNERAARREAKVARDTAIGSSSAVEKIAALQTTAGAQVESYKMILQATLENPAARTEKVEKLLNSPEFQGLVQLQPEATPGASLGANGAALSAPVAFALPPAARPVVAFLKNGNGFNLVTGAQKLPETSLWDLANPDAPRRTFPLETTRLFASADAEGVVALAEGDARASLLLAEGPAVSSGKSAQPIASAGLIREGHRYLVVLGTTKGSVGLWDAIEGSPVRYFSTGEKGVVNSIGFVPARSIMIASGDEGWAKVWIFKPAAADALAWNPPPPAIATYENARTSIHGASIQPERGLVLLPGSAELLIRPLDPKELAGFVTLQHQAPVQFAKFSPDGTMIASSDTNGRVYLWNLDNLRVLNEQSRVPKPWKLPASLPDPVFLTAHRQGLTSLQWEPHGNYLLTTGADGLAVVWQRPKARAHGEFNEVPYLLPAHPGGVTDAAISPDGGLVATVGADAVARVFPLRPVMRGKFRAWGGPNATGIQGGSDLALLSKADAGGEYKDYFLPDSKDSRGLVYRLNPATRYICARWDYSRTSRSFLRTTKVRIRRLNPTGQPIGEVVEAQPVDWGPPAKLGYDFDISDGVIRALSLQPDDAIEVEIPIIPNS